MRSNTYSNNNKLEKIILNTNEHKLLMWGNTVEIGQPYKIKFRTEGDYDNLWIEFDAVEHLEYAKEFHKKIYDCIDQMINPEIETELKVELYQNKETNRSGIKLSALIQKYVFRVSESWNIE